MLVIILYGLAALFIVAGFTLAFGPPAGLIAAGAAVALVATDLSRPSPGGPL